MIGETIGAYRILDKLGEGGMGEVFKGMDIMLGRPVAIKCLHPRAANNEDLVERFRREAIALARLHHPNIATLFSFLYAEERWLMVMEFAEGKTLDRVMRHFAQGMPSDLATHLAGQALQALAYAHSMGVIHRDLKPANMMIAPSGRLKLMDFGIARMLGEDSLTHSGVLVGTLKYMSPEQILGRELDGRADLYSLGVVLYEMLTGHAPFKAPSDYELLRAHVEEEPLSPQELAADLPESLADAVMRALRKRPDERFQNAMDFYAAIKPAQDFDPSVLAPILGDSGIHYTTAVPKPPESAPLDHTLSETVVTGSTPAPVAALAGEPLAALQTETATVFLNADHSVSRLAATTRELRAAWMAGWLRWLAVGAGVASVLALVLGIMLLGPRPTSPSKPQPQLPSQAQPQPQTSVQPQPQVQVPVQPEPISANPGASVASAQSVPVAEAPAIAAPDVPAADPRIAELLQQARFAFEQTNYREPPGDNALSYADQVLKIDPTQPEAQEIIRAIGRHYYEMGEALHRKGKRKLAEPYLSFAGELVITYPEIFSPSPRAATKESKRR